MTARTLPSLLLPGSWTLTAAVVGGPSIELSRFSPAGRMVLPAGFADRRPRVDLQLRAGGQVRTDSLDVALAPVQATLTATTTEWRQDEVDVDFVTTIANLSDAPFDAPIFIEGPTTTGRLAPGSTTPIAVGSVDVGRSSHTVTTAPDAPEVGFRLVVGSQSTPPIRLQRPQPSQVCVADSTWLPAYLAATAAAGDGDGEHGRGWSDEFGGWAEKAADSGSTTGHTASTGPCSKVPMRMRC